MVGLCGEFPSGQLNRLIESDSYAEKVVTDLKQSKLIRTHYKDGLRGYRLTKRAKELLLSQNPCRFQNYLTGNAETNLIRSELPRRLRLHQKAETYLTLSHAGIPFFPDEKPLLFSESSEAATFPVRSLPLFYSSREIKNLGASTTKIKNSRCIGILMAPHCVYAVYNHRKYTSKMGIQNGSPTQCFFAALSSGTSLPWATYRLCHHDWQ